MERVDELEIEEAGAGEGRSKRPSYNEMLTYAVGKLRRRKGSSSLAIQKFLKRKHGDLPPSFRKLLPVKLRKLVSTGQLVKVKNSYKLSPPARRRRAYEEAYAKAKRAMVDSLIDQFSDLYARTATTHKRNAKRKAELDVINSLIIWFSVV